LKLLTVTVPCYNSADYMSNCIESLLVGGDRMEIIIIDDGSKDDTGRIADEYAAKYPDIVRVVHQENGGHGEGINQGLAHANGKYFKTVDSDDTVTDLLLFLDTLEQVDGEGGVDLFLTNYRYVYPDGVGDRTIDFSNALPENRVFTWEETKPFRVDQILMIHTCTWRTELLRTRGLVMPKHLFYEDNFMVYGNLVGAQKMYYMNIDFYRYFIGRADQSVQESVMVKRYHHQLKATELCFTCCHLDGISSPRKLAYMKHEMFIMFGIAAIYARMANSPEADAALKQMWQTCRDFDKKWADHFRKRTALTFLHFPGKVGRDATIGVYRLAHRIVRFN